MADLLAEEMVHVSNGACVDDVTPPTFAGIVALSANANGSLTASWATATDTATPIRYEIYIKKDTSTDLFDLDNIALITSQLSATLFVDSDNELFVEGQTYYVGVRAVDAVGNRETNVVSISGVSQGVLPQNVSQLVSLVAAGLRNQDALEMKIDNSQINIEIEDTTIESEITDTVDLDC